MRQLFLLAFTLGVGLLVLSVASPAGAQAFCTDCSLDTNGDGQVDLDDHALCLGESSSGWSAQCSLWDLDGDLIVALTDLALFLACPVVPFVCEGVPALSPEGRAIALLAVGAMGAIGVGVYVRRRRRST